MNNRWLKYILVFILVVLIQGLVVNNMEVHEFVNPMVYPLLILVLPFELGVLTTIIIAFVVGISVDAFSNTFGLHTSATLVIGYFRPTILRYIKPRDGYDSSLFPTIHDMGVFWFFSYATLFLVIHHLWFFTIEIFSFDSILLLIAKTFFSTIFSLVLIVLLQYLFYTRSKR
ncbi:MAG: hypothetical protein IPM74_18425 [Crocinitomicaceae bacterium]|nr:hypothetical protein [Crocinitomicaceae bacterium]MBK8927820.1 hypothetical protein [Crocinitomicaceae bacterium]